MHRLGKASYEKIEPGPGRSFAFRAFDLPAFDSPWHFHPEIELTLVLEGTGRRFVGDHIEDFRPGDLVLIGAELPHYWHSDPSDPDRAHSLVVQFRPDFLGSDFFGMPEMDGIGRLLALAGQGISYRGETRERVSAILQGMDERTPQGQVLALLEILNILSQSEEGECLATEGFAPTLDTRTEERINRCQAWIFEHLAEPFRLEDVAEHMNMSPSAFSRYFKKVMGKTFSRFVNELRIGQACRALLESDQPIASIAYQAGFNNLSNFNRRVRELRGVSPRQFRESAVVKE